MMHREAIKAYLANVELKDAHVIDWGSGSKPAMRYIKHDNCEFTTVDNAPGIPDDRKSNHQDLDLTQQIDLFKADAAFCIEVVEHVEDVDTLLENIYYNLKPKGKFYFSAPFRYPVHAEADYWRFTENGVRLLLQEHLFKIIRIQPTVDDMGFFVEAYK